MVGGGPAGATASLLMARKGVDVTLFDKANFPRDKACGDVVGPRAVRILSEIGIGLPEERWPVGEMLLSRGSVGMVLPSHGGVGFDGFGYSIKRQVLDHHLLRCSLGEGTKLVTGRVTSARSSSGGAEVTCEGERFSFDILVGADGANSLTARMAGLVDENEVEMGFALRRYLDAFVEIPRIDLLAPGSVSGLAGYGWIFPNGGGVNAGVGVAVGQERSRARGLREHLERYLAGFSDPVFSGGSEFEAGGWLKMGMLGTVPARGRILLAGDAAGLVNPFQGEGIAAAIESGRMAAEAVAVAGTQAAVAYRRRLYQEFLPFQSAGHLALRTARRRPGLAGAAMGGLLLLGRRRPAVAAGWGLFWNDLTNQAGPAPGAAVAGSLARAGALASRVDQPARRYRAAGWMEQQL